MSFSVRDGVLDRLRSYLTDGYYTVRHQGTESTRCVSIYGVPQGSVLGPLYCCLFYTRQTLEELPANMLMNINAHFYADDSQLSAKPQHTDDTTAQLLGCMEANGQWTASDRLKLNPVKTDLLWCTTRRRQHQLNRNSVVFCAATPYINQLVSRCFYQLRCIKVCVKALPMDVAKTAVNSFIVSRVDYCNCLLAEAPQYQLNKLQAVMNST